MQWNTITTYQKYREIDHRSTMHIYMIYETHTYRVCVQKKYLSLQQLSIALFENNHNAFPYNIPPLAKKVESLKC